MKVHRIEVEHFRCIERARVELGPGLNVLFGPNDLGKSSLATALRAALLMPHSSSAAEEFLQWHCDEQPSVKVWLEDHDRRFWRVEKRFARTQGASLLFSSTDGNTYASAAQARMVDDELRGLLDWGIAGPATKGAPRGLPQSFLATVLLGEQTNVAGVLNQTLAADSNDSGRDRLTTALEAFAQDPTFKRILEEAQSHVDEAFTATGRRRSGQASPFREATDAVKRRQTEVDELQVELNKTESVRVRLQQLQLELDQGQAELQEAVEEHGELARWLQQHEARRAVAAELATSQKALSDDLAALDAIRKLEVELSAQGQQVAKDESGRTTLILKRDELAKKLDAAEDALRVAKSAGSAREKQLKAQALANERLRIEASRTQTVSELDRVKRADDLDQKARIAEGELVAKDEQLRDLAVAAEAAERGRLQTETELTLLDTVEHLQRRDHLRQELSGMAKLRNELEEERARATELHRQASELLGRRDAALPSPDDLGELEAIAQELEVAEARLGGGLSMAVTLTGGTPAELECDGASAQALDSSAEAHAEREMTLRLAGVGTIRVTAGAREAQEGARRVRERWRQVVAPVLEGAEAADVEALRVRVAADSDLTKRSEGLQAQAQSIEAQTSTRMERVTEEARLGQQLEAVDQSLTGSPIPAAEKILADLGTETVAERRTRLRSLRDESRREIDRLRNEREALSGATEVLRERAASARRGLAGLGLNAPTEGWPAERERLGAEVEAAILALDGVAAQEAALAVEAETQLEQATARLQEATSSHVSAVTELEELEQKLRARREERSRLAGGLEPLQAAAAAIDLPARKAHVAEIEQRLRDLPEPTREVAKDDVEAALTLVDTRRRSQKTKEDEHTKELGALETVGGEVVREQVREAEEALEQAKVLEQEVELDYDAWQLLATALREAENTEGDHLGRALAAPVAERFGQLTAGRYSDLAVDTHLRTEGLLVGGELRDVSCFSTGTQEQLATLLRLTVAEHLGTFLVLDDHLTQTDPGRTALFRDILREHASKGQIIVLTCRPLDYLRETDFPAIDDAIATRGAGLIRSVNLEKLIQRGGR